MQAKESVQLQDHSDSLVVPGKDNLGKDSNRVLSSWLYHSRSYPWIIGLP